MGFRPRKARSQLNQEQGLSSSPKSLHHLRGNARYALHHSRKHDQRGQNDFSSYQSSSVKSWSFLLVPRACKDFQTFCWVRWLFRGPVRGVCLPRQSDDSNVAGRASCPAESLDLRDDERLGKRFECWHSVGTVYVRNPSAGLLSNLGARSSARWKIRKILTVHGAVCLPPIALSFEQYLLPIALERLATMSQEGQTGNDVDVFSPRESQKKGPWNRPSAVGHGQRPLP